MSVLISAQLKPSYYKRYDAKASSERPPRAPVKIPNKKARFAEVVNGRAAMQGVAAWRAALGPYVNDRPVQGVRSCDLILSAAMLH